MCNIIEYTGNANSTQLHLMQFHALTVPVTRAINPHIALSTVPLIVSSMQNLYILQKVLRNLRIPRLHTILHSD